MISSSQEIILEAQIFACSQMSNQYIRIIEYKNFFRKLFDFYGYREHREVILNASLSLVLCGRRD